MGGQRIYRTDDGRHVPEGDPEGTFLAYSQFDEPPKSVLVELARTTKAKAAVDNKQRTTADK